MSLVNCRRAQSSNYTSTSQHKKLNQQEYGIISNNTLEDIFSLSVNKEYRMIYFNKCMKFYHEIKKMCELLKTYPKENLENPLETRDEIMRNNNLSYFNQELFKLRKEPAKGINKYVYYINQ